MAVSNMTDGAKAVLAFRAARCRVSGVRAQLALVWWRS